MAQGAKSTATAGATFDMETFGSAAVLGSLRGLAGLLGVLALAELPAAPGVPSAGLRGLPCYNAHEISR